MDFFADKYCLVQALSASAEGVANILVNLRDEPERGSAARVEATLWAWNPDPVAYFIDTNGTGHIDNADCSSGDFHVKVGTPR